MADCGSDDVAWSVRDEAQGFLMPFTVSESLTLICEWKRTQVGVKNNGILLGNGAAPFSFCGLDHAFLLTFLPLSVSSPFPHLAVLSLPALI